MEIRRLKPPKLGDAHLGQRITGYRPMRHGAPRMEVTAAGGKLIAHNYGHGGSGWTLGPGSAEYVVNQLSQHVSVRDRQAPVAVIGAGALGLFSAVELLQHGFMDITIIAERFDELTSHIAGGLLSPASMDVKPKMQGVIDDISFAAHGYFLDIALGKHALFRTGARIVPAYFRSAATSGLERYVGHVMQPHKDVVVDFGNGTRRQMVVYDEGIFIDTGIMMRQLTDYLRGQAKDGIRLVFEQRRVASFTELQQEIIINCTGLEAAQLVADEKNLVPVQGHLVLLLNQTPKDIDYMIVWELADDVTSTGRIIKREFYMFPKHSLNAAPQDIGVIGGTFIEGADSAEPNPEQFLHVIEGARSFFQ